MQILIVTQNLYLHYTDLLLASLEVIEEVLESTNRRMKADKKAELVAAIYERYDDTEKEVDRKGILRLIKATV